MTPAEISIVTTRLLADIQALSKNVSDALKEHDVDESRKAWRSSADALGSVISDVATLAQNDSTWATLLGGASTVDALRLSYNKAFEAYTKSGDINDVRVGDMLGVMGGVSDLAGGILVKPGPQFFAGLALKGIGLGAAMGQNAVDDGLTIGQLVAAAPSNVATQSTSPMMEIVVTATRLSSASVDTPADSATRTSNNYISDTSANDHLVEIKTGGTVWDAYVLQKNTNNGFEDWSDFKSAVAVSNPAIADLNNISAGTKLYVPEKFADGSITYNYADGTAINSNAATGEYQMVVQNADGGQTVYSRTVDGDTGYVVHQVTTDKTGNITNEYNGHQDTLNSDTKIIDVDTYALTINGQTYTHQEFDAEGNLTEVQTAVYDSTKGLTSVNVYHDGELIGHTAIQGQATQAQLDKALALSEQLASATSLGGAGQSDSGESLLHTLNILDAQETAQLEAGVQQLSFVDTQYSGSNVASTPVFSSLAANQTVYIQAA